MIVCDSIYVRRDLVCDLDELSIVDELNKAFILREARLIEAMIHFYDLDFVISEVIVYFIDHVIIHLARLKHLESIFILLFMVR